MRNRAKYVSSEAAIKKYLKYDSHTGIFYWIAVPPHSRVNVGDIAGCTSANGHTIIKLRGSVLWAHCVAWWIVTGKWPEDEIDHENVNPSDNRFANLRPATRTQNSQNRRRKSGKRLKGAYTHPSMNGRWFAQIVVNKRQIYLGRFDSEQLAHDAYCHAAREHHGEFARVA